MSLITIQKRKSAEIAQMSTLLLPHEFDGVEIREFLANRPHPGHFHEEYQFTLVRRGKGTFRVGNTTRNLGPGSVCVTAPNEIHQALPQDGQSWQLMVFLISPIYQQQATEECEGVAPAFAFKEFDYQRNRLNLADVLVNSFRSFEEPTTLLEQQTNLFLLVQSLQDQSIWQPGQPSGRKHQTVARMIDYLSDHLTDNVSLDELAVVTQLSKFHLLRVFRDEVGLPPHAFQIQLRIAQAKKLLRQGHSIVETALAVGFADQAHLTRSLRKIYYTTPQVYRQTAISFKTRTA